jgi:hypothetical protein
MSAKDRLNKFSTNMIDFLEHKTTLILMTILVAFCSSTFAWQYGKQFDWRYSLLFFVALAALTFHYAKKIPKKVLAVMQAIAIIGLILFTIFVSCAAWLSIGTSKADPQITAVERSISSLEDQIRSRNQEILYLQAMKQPVNARSVGDIKAKLEARLAKKQEKLEQLASKQGVYESGSMAIFGHIQAITGLEQETVNLSVMFALLLVLICMEITMGAAATTKKQ